MRAATEGHLPPVMLQGNLVEVLGREVRKGSPGELMVESSPSRQRRPPCTTSKEMSDEAADAAALTYLLTDLGYTYDDLLSKKLRDVINMDDMKKIPIQAREFKPMVSFPVDFGVGNLKETFTGQFHV